MRMYPRSIHSKMGNEEAISDTEKAYLQKASLDIEIPGSYDIWRSCFLAQTGKLTRNSSFSTGIFLSSDFALFK